ncbi:aminotransferase class IV [Segetibacter koreensis]|uniref:aminotransferase class IV n=1 Tax=Segetibacter koreensis TaxID=398037 RepID=UPI00037E5261|nr:aminotransferase class IV [Segetibacter koreensis]
MIAFVNNQFIEESKATLGISDLSIQRGYGVFDFFRTSNFTPLFLDDYLDRFFTSAATLRLQPMHSKKELKKIIGEMIRQNNIADASFRLILTGGYSDDSYQPASPNFIIIQQAVQLPGNEKFIKGIKIILHEYMRDLPTAKSINYLMGVYLQEKVKQKEADDVLYHKDGCVLEFPRSNVFVVTKDGKVVTPAENVLKGITRKKVLELARQKYTVEERAVTIDELKNAAEVFLTSTTKRIIPVLSIDNTEIGDGKPGEITAFLLEAFLKMEANLIAATAEKYAL